MTKFYQLPDLSSEQGNAFVIMALVKKALKENGMENLVDGYIKRASEYNYATLIGESYMTLEMINEKINK